TVEMLDANWSAGHVEPEKPVGALPPLPITRPESGIAFTSDPPFPSTKAFSVSGPSVFVTVPPTAQSALATLRRPVLSTCTQRVPTPPRLVSVAPSATSDFVVEERLPLDAAIDQTTLGGTRRPVRVPICHPPLAIPSDDSTMFMLPPAPPAVPPPT